MKLYHFIIKHRPVFIFIFLTASIITNYFFGFWSSLILYAITAILIFSHFFFGPLRLIQQYMEEGNIDKAKKVLESIKYPNLLYKPLRSVYYTIKGSMAMMDKNFDSAEKDMKKSLKLGSPMKEAEGVNKMQLGMLAMQKGNVSEAEKYLKQALRDGIPDKESKAMAHLQLSSIYANKRLFKVAKENFRRAKSLNPTNEEVKKQIKELDKYMSRLPR